MRRPCEFLASPDHFARVPGTQPATPLEDLSPEERPYGLAAMQQHRFGLALRAHMDSHRPRLNQRQVAELAGLSVHKVNQLLNGRAWTTAPTMYALVLALEAIDLLPTPDSIADLYRT